MGYMKPAKNVGIVSSFFTYTGPTDGTPWDEIDIEFLGKDTTKVQFNYYTNGVGNHEKIVNLGFDAANSYHTYAFDWQPNSIKWYVEEWLGSYNGVTPLHAHDNWVRKKITL